MGDFKANLGRIMVIVGGDEELRWMRNMSCITHRSCLCVYVHVWISGFFVILAPWTVCSSVFCIISRAIPSCLGNQESGKWTLLFLVSCFSTNSHFHQTSSFIFYLSLFDSVCSPLPLIVFISTFSTINVINNILLLFLSIIFQPLHNSIL